MGSMEFIYAGLIVLYAGWPIMRLLVFPWAFFHTMWPYNFMEDIALTPPCHVLDEPSRPATHRRAKHASGNRHPFRSRCGPFLRH